MIGDRDKRGNVLRYGGWVADLWERPNRTLFLRMRGDIEVVDVESVQEATDVYNELNNTKYDVIPLPKLSLNAPPPLPPEYARIPKGVKILKRYESESKPGTHYYVYQFPSGNIACTCPGYGYRRKCRHVEEVKNESR